MLVPPSPRAAATHALSSLPASTERLMQYDEHLVDIDELERRLSTHRHAGLASELVAQRQSESPQLNLLPIDAEVGHGGIHELVGVLRDGSWLHTRAENLLPGDVIALKEGQCVPADVRLLECHDMWVDQSVLLGKRACEQRVATATSVFDHADDTVVPYMEARNVAFYGTTVTRGHGKAIVIRTGEDTVLGTISSALMRKKREGGKRGGEVPMTEILQQQFDSVLCRNDLLPAAINRVSALVVEHSDVIKRTVISASFGVNPTVIIELEDVVVANETSADELEREIALQMLSYCHASEDAAVFTKALAACRHRVESASQFGAAPGSGGDAAALTPTPTPTNVPRVPSLPASSPIAAPVVIDPVRDQSAILRFCAQFGSHSPRNVSAGASGRKTRYSTLLHTQVSSCEVYVHFDGECGAHVVLLQGPAREILSRCGKVRRDGGAMAPLETADLQKIQDMVMDLEARNETVVSFAELYLDPALYPVGVKFDIESFNFPTSNMCYLGSLGLVEKLQPEVVLMGSFARAADVRLLVATIDREYAEDNAPYLDVDDDDTIQDNLDDIDNDDDDVGARGRVRCVCKIPVRLREASTGEVIDVDACVFRSNVLSISNTLSQWRQILSQHAIVIFDGCSPAQVDLLVETLQELGECVGLVASGSANALALSNADIGFAIPAQEVIDLSEEAADVVLSSVTCPRSDAIRLIDAVKKSALKSAPTRGSIDGSALRVAPMPSATKAKSVVVNLLRESISAGRLLGLSESDLKACFDAALADTSSSATAFGGFSGASPRSSSGTANNNNGANHAEMAASSFAFTPLSPSKFPPSAFRSAGVLLNPGDDATQAAVSSI